MAERTRLDRLLWVIDTFSGKGDRRPFDRLIGINEGHTAVIVKRLENDPEAGLDGVTLAKIMKVLGVNPLWLLFGEEPRRIDVGLGDPELAPFLATLAEHPDLRQIAFSAHGRVSEVKALLKLLETRELLPYSSREGGAIDWLQALTHYREGKLRASSDLPSAKGIDQARVEQGPVPKKVKLPPPSSERPTKRK
jgi:hypothetical protein